MMADYVVWLCDWQGNHVRMLTSWYRLEYTRALNDVGHIRIDVDEWMAVERDMRLTVWRNGVLEGVWFVTGYRREWDTRRTTIRGACPNDLLRRRVVAYHEDTAQGKKTAVAADTAIYQLVDENMGSGAGNRSLLPYIGVLPPAGTSAQVTMTVAWKRVLDAVLDVTKAAHEAGTWVWWKMRARSERDLIFEVRTTVWGRDRRGDDLVFSPRLGTARNVVEEMDWSDEVTAAYGMGSGVKKPLVREVVRFDLETPFARCEDVARASREESDNAVEAAALALLSERRARIRQYGDIIDTARTRYRVHWDLGDVLTVVADDVRFDVAVQAVHVAVSGEERITPKLVHYE